MMSVFEAWMSALRATKSTFLVLDERFRAWRSDDGVQEIETRCFRCLSLPRLLTGRARDGDESRVRMPGRRCVLPAAGTLVAAALCCACVGVAGIELDDVMAALPAMATQTQHSCRGSSQSVRCMACVCRTARVGVTAPPRRVGVGARRRSR